MGQHTWFRKSKIVEKAMNDVFKLCEESTTSSTVEIILSSVASDLHDYNNTEFHDLFRTNKRNENLTYTDDQINSYEEMVVWLFKNRHLLYGEFRKQSLRDFWKKYPEGCINFG